MDETRLRELAKKWCGRLQIPEPKVIELTFNIDSECEAEIEFSPGYIYWIKIRPDADIEWALLHELLEYMLDPISNPHEHQLKEAVINRLGAVLLEMEEQCEAHICGGAL